MGGTAKDDRRMSPTRAPANARDHDKRSQKGNCRLVRLIREARYFFRRLYSNGIPIRNIARKQTAATVKALVSVKSPNLKYKLRHVMRVTAMATSQNFFSAAVMTDKNIIS